MNSWSALATLAVAQELVAQAHTRVCALQKSRNVGEHCGAEIRLADSEVGDERCEGVVRHLRLC